MADGFMDAGAVRLAAAGVVVAASAAVVEADEFEHGLDAASAPRAYAPARYRPEVHGDGLPSVSDMLQRHLASADGAAAGAATTTTVSASEETGAVAAFSELFQRSGVDGGVAGHLVDGASDEISPDKHGELDAAAREAALSRMPAHLQAMMREALAAVQAGVATSATATASSLAAGATAAAPAAPASTSVAPLAGAAASASQPTHLLTPVDAPAASLMPGASAPLRVAVAQMHCVAGDVKANVARVEAVLAALAKPRGASAGAAATGAAAAAAADLVVFPETFLQGYHIGGALLRALAVELPSAEQLEAALASNPGRSASAGTATAGGDDAGAAFPCGNPLLRIAQLAAAYRIAIILPFAELSTAPDVRSPHPAPAAVVYNTSICFDADGWAVGHYRKTHLWGEVYEKRIFTPGPGPLSHFMPNSAHRAARPAALARAAGTGSSTSSGVPLITAAQAQPSPGVYRYSPYVPFTLASHPVIPIGLLICFDMEFPEPTRMHALAGARVVISTHASGEGHGFTSRAIAPTRAAENHVCLVFSNFPSAPLPEEVEERCEAAAGDTATMRRFAPHPVAEDTISVAYSGGSSVCAPTGEVLFAAAAYPCNANVLAGLRPYINAAPVVTPAYDAAASTAVTAELAASGHVKHAGAITTDGGAAAPATSISSGDEAVVVVSFDATLPHYVRDIERNPYLQDRRTDLFAPMSL